MASICCAHPLISLPVSDYAGLGRVIGAAATALWHGSREGIPHIARSQPSPRVGAHTARAGARRHLRPPQLAAREPAEGRPPAPGPGRPDGHGRLSRLRPRHRPDPLPRALPGLCEKDTCREGEPCPLPAPSSIGRARLIAEPIMRVPEVPGCGPRLASGRWALRRFALPQSHSLNGCREGQLTSRWWSASSGNTGQHLA